MNDLLEHLKFISAHAFANVILWVAISYFFFQMLNYFSNGGFSQVIKKNKKLQPLLAAMMGSIPGSGSTLFLFPMYKEGSLSFAALVSAFIATMGETAFILLVGQPILYLWMVLFSFIISVIVGYFLLFINVDKYVEGELLTNANNDLDKRYVDLHNKEHQPKNQAYHMVFNIMMPSLFAIAITLALPYFIVHTIEMSSDSDHEAHSILMDEHEHEHEHSGFLEAMDWFYFVTTIILLTSFTLQRTVLKNYNFNGHVHIHKDSDKVNLKKDVKHIAYDTYDHSLFMFVWVFIAMFIVTVPFEYIPELSHDVYGMFDDIGFIIALIFIGGFISIIPGCGVNILFTGWILAVADHAHTDGIAFTLPFAILITNSMAQDGDAGFPLLANNKRCYFIMKGINISVGIIFGLLFIPLTSVLPGIVV